jgi:hypothetical protein
MNQGTKWVLLMQKNRRRKSHAWATLRAACNICKHKERNCQMFYSIVVPLK